MNTKQSVLSFNFIFSKATRFIILKENMRSNTGKKFSDLVYQLKLVGASETGFLINRGSNDKFEFTIDKSRITLDMEKISQILYDFNSVSIEGGFKIS